MAGDARGDENGFRVGGLFAGIGGIERGFQEAGHHAAFFSEYEPAAAAVLRKQFPGVPIYSDVRDLAGRADELPHIDVLTGGFPCQDLSQAGRAAGIGGDKSGLVSHMFDLLDRLDARPNPPSWFVIENVTNMLCLDGGQAMNFLTDALEQRDYGWAYRAVDTLGFGLPQRRKRVIMLASRRLPLAPSWVLFADEAGEQKPPEDPECVGFYWTEGLRGLGWAPNAVPTLKGGSGVGIPSPPAVWMRKAEGDTETFRTPSLEQAEQLQGFSPGWTDAVMPGEGRQTSIGERWKMVGNAVSVPVARWLASRMTRFGTRDEFQGGCSPMVRAGTSWPDAASGYAGKTWLWDRSNFPLPHAIRPLLDFIGEPEQPLSVKAALGFRERTLRGNLRLDPEFAAALTAYLEANGVPHSVVLELSRERAEAAERRREERTNQLRLAI